MRVAFVGSQPWMDCCTPPDGIAALELRSVVLTANDDAAEDDLASAITALEGFDAHAMILLDAAHVPERLIEYAKQARATTLGVLVGGAPHEHAHSLSRLDRLVSFVPSLTGSRIGSQLLWRAIPPPISDVFYCGSDAVRPLHRAPRAMAVGRSTEHREVMLMPAKHHHDLLQVLHGVSGTWLAEIAREYDVGVFIARGPGGGFGWQVGMHLACGHLLLSDELRPRHGLERNIDYLQVESADELVSVLDRMGRFPEMHHRLRVRGRLKAEQYRASRVFARITHDLLADVRAFGGASRGEAKATGSLAAPSAATLGDIGERVANERGVDARRAKALGRAAPGVLDVDE